MPDIYIIIGGKNTRKSSTIRALTGAHSKGIYQIKTANNVLDTYVQISSLQESKITPQDFIKTINSSNANHVILSLWINASKKYVNQHPHGVNYIDEFIKAGWEIKQITVLGAANLPNLPNNAPHPNYIQNAQNMPSNQIASQIRSIWNWL